MLLKCLYLSIYLFIWFWVTAGWAGQEEQVRWAGRAEQDASAQVQRMLPCLNVTPAPLTLT